MSAKANDWVDIVLENEVRGEAKYCVEGNLVTIALHQIVLPDVGIVDAKIIASIPEEILPSSELPVREVTLMSNGGVANIIIAKEGYILFESYQEVPALTNFSVYKSYLID